MPNWTKVFRALGRELVGSKEPNALRVMQGLEKKAAPEIAEQVSKQIPIDKTDDLVQRLSVEAAPTAKYDAGNFTDNPDGIIDISEINNNLKRGLSPNPEQLKAMEADVMAPEIVTLKTQQIAENQANLDSEDIAKYLEFGDEKAPLAQVIKDKMSYPKKERVMDLKTSIIDSNAPIEFAGEAAKKAKNVTKISNSYYASKVMQGKISGAINQYRDAMEDIGMSLSNAEERRASQIIWSLESLKEQGNRGVVYGQLTPETIDKHILELKNRYGARYDKIHDVAKKWSKYNNEFRMARMSDAEVPLATADTLAKWNNDYKWYMPHVQSKELLDELFSEKIHDFRKNGITGTSLNFLKKQQGGKYIPDMRALDRALEGTARMLVTQEKMRVNKYIAQDFGVVVQFGKKEMRDAATGKMKIISYPKNVPEGWRMQAKFLPGDDKVFAFSPEVFNYIKNMNRKQSDIITNAVAHMNKSWKLMTTTYRLPFAIMNTPRDTLEAFMNEKGAEAGVNAVSMFLQPSLLAKSFWASFQKNMFGVTDNAIWKEAEAAGALHGSRMGDKWVENVPFKFQTAKQKASKIIQFPLHLIHDFSAATEAGLRIAQFKRLKNAGYPSDFAASLGRDITIDFEKMGNTTRIVNKYVPFLNATEQGLVNMAGNFKYQPMATTLKALGGLSALSMIYLSNKLNDDDFDQVDPYMKDNYIVLNSGIKIRGKAYYYTMPGMPRSAVLPWKGIRRAIDIAIEKNPKNKEILKKQLMEGMQDFGLFSELTNMMVPPPVKLAYELPSNYDMWRERNIVPYSKQGLPARLQSRPSTTNMYRGLGKLAGQMGIKDGISPAKIEHAMRTAIPAIKQFEPIINGILDNLFMQEYLDAPAVKEDINIVDKVSKAIPLIRRANYDPNTQIIYDTRQNILKDRSGRLELAKRAIRSMVLSSGKDDQAMTHYRQFVKGLDKDQMRSLVRFKKDLILSERMGPRYKAWKSVAKKDRYAVREAMLEY